ncbi:hypothetical protein conserved [Leishmania donovani]|uniref:Hypothetical_protein_conserved n=1 Tax=Leishmania donovani TaxID=5661 RepID=A0A6J8F6V0_LEIDO|nr:hypothetical protein conserved [Leishmania donovani]VDZ42255.1 hypothetical_protein_conserved [Leishmania donovani]
MDVLHTASVDGRICCAANEEVWVAKQSGGIAVFSARSGDHMTDIALKADDGSTAAQVTHMMAVFGEVWVSTKEGRVHFYELATHTPVDSMLIPGAEKKVQVVNLSFNGHVAVIATASGSVYVHHPLNHQRLGTLSTSTSPCTAAIQFYSFVVGGDASGALYLWDPVTGECVIYHGGSKSEVVALLHEPTTGTIWVSRANEHVDIYAVKDGALQLQRRVSGIGRVTGMVAVSGTVVATTCTKRLVQIEATTAKITVSVAGAHDKFIHGCCKAMHQEVAQVWSVGNDGTLRVWHVAGLQVPVVPLPKLPPAAQAALTSAVEDTLNPQQSELRAEAQAELHSRMSMEDKLMKAREEAQELRLRIFKEEERRLMVDAALTAERKHRKELEERNAKLAKEVTDIASNVAVAERERNGLRAEVTQLKMDLSNARTETSVKQTEKSSIERQLSEERTKKDTLEQRLRDVEGMLSSLQAEHRRMCEALGSATAHQQTSKAPTDALMSRGAALSAELEHARKMNALMGSAIASMEYTIRRREEEDRDLVALLNAFRGRVADRVTDPNLSALLLATIVRNAPRFDLQCDEFTKAELMERNGPFLQFIQSLRATDPEAYRKLMQYLQNPSIAQGLPADTQALLDRFVALASKEGEVSGEDIANFKKTIPCLTDSVAVQGAGQIGSGSSTAPADFPALLGADASGSGKPGGDVVAPGRLLGNNTDGGLTIQEEVVNNALMRELHGQRVIDENYIREQQTMFEFILKTRRLLVESLAILHKRTVSARQVVDALCVNTSAHSTSSPATTPSRRSLQTLHSIFSGVVRELEELTTEVIQRYLSGAEKQRLGVAQ